jgi:hypothetical protein
MASRPPTRPAGARGPSKPGASGRGPAKAGAPGAKKKGPKAFTREAYEVEIRELEGRIAKLKTAYERFFMGLDKIPPEKDRGILERDLRQSALYGAARIEHRLRFQNLTLRMVCYQGYWDRFMRRIEEGTFRRDRTAAIATPEPRLLAVLPEPEPHAEEPEPPAAEDPTRQLYESWVAARNALRKGETKTPFDHFKAQLAKLREQQLAKYGCIDVAWRLNVQDGKVQITARPVFTTPEPD